MLGQLHALSRSVKGFEVARKRSSKPGWRCAVDLERSARESTSHNRPQAAISYRPLPEIPPNSPLQVSALPDVDSSLSSGEPRRASA